MRAIKIIQVLSYGRFSVATRFGEFRPPDKKGTKNRYFPHLSQSLGINSIDFYLKVHNMLNSIKKLEDKTLF